MEEEIARLKAELMAKSDEVKSLKEQLKQQKETDSSQGKGDGKYPRIYSEHESISPILESLKLDNDQIARYSRQLILPEIGPKGQLKLSGTSVLIVGAGGLGCPAAVYLTAAGIGRLGLVDYDEVELSNLHRQILHTECRVGVTKSASVSYACNKLNSRVECIPYHLALNSTNALDIIKAYDIVIDATDNVATRYLLNDACVLAGKPLVSGSALRFEGQLTVYNHAGGPCYRCLFPKPPPPETVTNCSDGGVIGVVPGIIGCLQALEAIKLASGLDTSFRQKLLMFDAMDGSFRTIKLRPRQSGCVVCGDTPSITHLIDYEQFCGARATDKDKELQVLSAGDRISVKEYADAMKGDHVLVDVRQPVELEICQLPTSHVINVTLDDLSKEEKLAQIKSRISEMNTTEKSKVPVYVLCRKGNDSQLAVKKLQEYLKDLPVTVQDIRGGLHAWAKHIDTDFPVY